ncbi:unnamed protein product, partial [Candidula unifasciata]
PSGDSNFSGIQFNVKKGGFDRKARTRLILAIVLCLILAIISDASHLLTDFASFMISLLALYLAHRPVTKTLSIGWYRIEILGAFVFILMLWVRTGILVYSAVLRIMDDNFEIDASVMLLTVGTGVAFNVVLGVTLHQHAHSHGGGHGYSHGGSDHSHQKQKTEKTGHGHAHEQRSPNINVKAAFIHVVGDLFQTVGVLWKIVDPICTFLLSQFVLITTITIIRDILVLL